MRGRGFHGCDEPGAHAADAAASASPPAVGGGQLRGKLAAAALQKSRAASLAQAGERKCVWLFPGGGSGQGGNDGAAVAAAAIDSPGAGAGAGGCPPRAAVARISSVTCGAAAAATVAAATVAAAAAAGRGPAAGRDGGGWGQFMRWGSRRLLSAGHGRRHCRRRHCRGLRSRRRQSCRSGRPRRSRWHPRGGLHRPSVGMRWRQAWRPAHSGRYCRCRRRRTTRRRRQRRSGRGRRGADAGARGGGRAPDVVGGPAERPVPVPAATAIVAVAAVVHSVGSPPAAVQAVTTVEAGEYSRCRGRWRTATAATGPSAPPTVDSLLSRSHKPSRRRTSSPRSSDAGRVVPGRATPPVRAAIGIAAGQPAFPQGRLWQPKWRWQWRCRWWWWRRQQ